MNKRLNNLKTTEMYLKEIVAKFGDEFDYSLVEYRSAKDYITIICKTHGIFKQEASYFVNKSKGCPNCIRSLINSSMRSSKTVFITKANLVHEGLFDYSLVDYFKSSFKVKIICPIHGVFEQTPNNHLRGRGCNQCRISKSSSKSEKELCKFVDNYGFSYEVNNRYSWLDNKELDIYIPVLKLAIEYNGFVYHHSTKGLSPFLDSTSVDFNYHLHKYNLCKANGVNLLHIFEFESMTEWQVKLNDYFLNPSDFSIYFDNLYRNITMYNKTLIFYGISNIIRTT